MLTLPFAASATNPFPTPAPNSLSDPSRDPLERVRRTANSISTRVRHALTPEGFRPMRVLVVDDQPDAADTLAAVVELLDCPVRVCYTGLAALQVVEAFDPQVCLLDLKMPGMDGFELASRLQERADGRPLLLVATTALADAESKVRTALAGFHYHLTKPVDVSTLIDTLTLLGETLAPPGDSHSQSDPRDSQ